RPSRTKRRRGYEFRHQRSLPAFRGRYCRRPIALRRSIQSNTDAYTYTESNAHPHTKRHTDPGADSNTTPHADGKRDPNTNPHADAKRDSDPNSGAETCG